MKISWRYLCLVFVNFVATNLADSDRLPVICPPYESKNESISLPSYVSKLIQYRKSTDYCSCTLSAVGNSKTVIIICDFEDNQVSKYIMMYLIKYSFF